MKMLRLLFIDFFTGDVLQLTGRASISFGRKEEGKENVTNENQKQGIEENSEKILKELPGARQLVTVFVFSTVCTHIKYAHALTHTHTHTHTHTQTTAHNTCTTLHARTHDAKMKVNLTMHARAC